MAPEIVEFCSSNGCSFILTILMIAGAFILLIKFVSDKMDHSAGRK